MSSTFVAVSERTGKLELQKGLADLPRLGDTYIGKNGFETLNQVTARGRHITHVIIINERSQMMKFWKKALPIIVASWDRMDCQIMLTKLFERDYPLEEKQRKIFSQEIDSGESFLSTDDRYEFAKSLFEERRVAKIHGSIDSKKVISIVKAKKLSVDSVYLPRSKKNPFDSHTIRGTDIYIGSGTSPDASPAEKEKHLA